MDRCWAKPLGGCSDRLSGEHVFTAGLFGDTVFVQGFDWCKDPKQITNKSLVKNILCTNHNSRLSPLDKEAIKAFRYFQESVRLTKVREKLKPRYWNVQEWTIDGWKFERWFLKTMINIACESDRPIGKESKIPGQPSPDLVRIAFGMERFKGKAGLYFPAAVGQSLDSQDKLEYIPMATGQLKERGFLPGAFFAFRGHLFILYLGEEGLDVNAGIVLPRKFHSADLNVRPLFHLRTMNATIGKFKSHVIRFKW